GTKVSFIADEAIFKNYKYRHEYIVKMLKNYCYLNTGLTIYYNGEKFYSDFGLKDLLEESAVSKVVLNTKENFLTESILIFFLEMTFGLILALGAMSLIAINSGLFNGITDFVILYKGAIVSLTSFLSTVKHQMPLKTTPFLILPTYQLKPHRTMCLLARI
ncbi:MAG: hypothetical protein EOO10_07815, partial [Chitinophagaceae bacterium]